MAYECCLWNVRNLKKDYKPDGLNKCPGRQTQPTWLETKFYCTVDQPLQIYYTYNFQGVFTVSLKRLMAVLGYESFWWLTVSWWAISYNLGAHFGKWQLFQICQKLSWNICIHNDIWENLLHNVLGPSSFRNIWTKFDSGGVWRSTSSLHGHRCYLATCHLFVSCSCIVCWSLHMSAAK